MPQSEQFLTTTEFHILLALRDTSLHGYQIIKQIDQDTNGVLKLLTGTLYNALKRLVQDDLIEEATSPEGMDSRRKYYVLTEKGKKTLGLELARYESALRISSSHRFVSFSL